MKVLGLIALALALAGCDVLGGVAVYQMIQYNEDVKAGKAPSRDLLRDCNQEGTVRGADGNWTYSPDATRQCMTRAGWDSSSGEWKRVTVP